MQNRDANRSPNEQKMRGNWNQFKGKVREKWGGVTDDELEQTQGRRDQMVGRIQERTGEQRQNIERDLDTLSRENNYRFER